MSIDVTLSGYLVGPIWWPTGTECYRAFNYSITNEAARIGTRRLRNHVLAVMNDGDFQSTCIALGEVTIRSVLTVGSRVVTRSKTVPLASFSALSDCLHPDPDWFPGTETEDYAPMYDD